MPVKRTSRRNSKKVNKTVKRTSHKNRRSQKGGKRVSKSKTAGHKRSSRRSRQKGGLNGKVILNIGADKLEVTDSDILKAKSILEKPNHAATAQAMKVANLKTLVDKYADAVSTPDIKDAVLAVRRVI